MPRAQFEGDGLPLMDVVIASGFATSKGAARRMIEGGGIYVNNRRVSDARAMIGRADFIEGRYLVLRKGARDYHLIRAI